MPPFDPNNTGVARTTPYNGQLAGQAATAVAMNPLVNRTLFVSTAASTSLSFSGATTAQSMVPAAGYGSLQLATGYPLPGTIFRITVTGLLSTTTATTPTTTLALTYGSSSVLSFTSAALNAGYVGGVPFTLAILMQVDSLGSSGKILPSLFLNSTVAAQPVLAPTSSSEATVDFTQTNPTIGLTATFSATGATNSYTIYSFLAEVIG